MVKEGRIDMVNPFEKKENAGGGQAGSADDQTKQLHDAEVRLKKLDDSGDLKEPNAVVKKEKVRHLVSKRMLQFKDSSDDENVPAVMEREFKPPNVIEIKPIVNWVMVSLYMSIMGILAVIFICQYGWMQNRMIIVLMFFFGMCCFLPFGVIISWLFFNIDNRVKVLRRLRGKNYGIVHFVLRGGQRMFTRIMDLDGDVIVNNMRMWVIDKKGIYYLDRNGLKQLWAEISSEHVKTMPANIPVLYLDYETMIPLKFYKEMSQSNPQEVASTHLGYIANQIAKMLFFKKTMTFFYIIMIVITALTMVVAFQSAMWLSEIHEQTLPDLENKIDLIWGMVNPEYQTGNFTGGNFTGGGQGGSPLAPPGGN